MLASGWQFTFTGWPWWVVLPLAAAGIWALLRLHRRELSPLPAAQARTLRVLRGVALGLLILLLLEPTLTRRSVERVLPAVAVLVDHSGSMGVRDGGSPDSRYDQALKLARDKILPALGKVARVKAFVFNTELSPLDVTKPPGPPPARETDFEATLGALGRAWGREYVGGIVILSDGRQTRGADPAPIARAFHARGARVTGVMVGDSAVPNDAVVGEVSGPAEVFVGESIPLTVRYRVTGGSALDWDLVLSSGGLEIARRKTRGNGQWQYETFSFASTNAGVQVYQARLELSGEQGGDPALAGTGSAVLEVWQKVNGNKVSDLLESAVFQQRASSTSRIELLNYRNRGEQYGARTRGLLIPPHDGNYTFWIGSDDGSELWLSPNEKPSDKSKIAWVADYVPAGQWSSQPGQKSAPITLKARQPCYFEVLHKQGGGEDYLGVGWQLPDGQIERPIPGSRIAPFDDETVRQMNERRRQLAAARTNAWSEASLANNTGESSVAVSQDPIKVLLIDSTPRWESRYLAAMFERDRRVNFTRRYHSVIIDDANLKLLPGSQAEWDGYDMVCLGDLDAVELPPEQQQRLSGFVARRGGFLVCVAGPRGLPRAFSLGTLANLLPVRVTAVAGSAALPEPVAVALASQGDEHPITQILHDPGLNEKMWPMLPPLQWVADGVVAKPGATVLLTAANAARTPIVAFQRYGAGRVLWMGTEESWRWRDRLGERVHQTFWLQVMRWGLAGRLRGQNAALQVGLDGYLVAPGETAELKARVTRQGESASGSVPDSAPVVRVERVALPGDAAAPKAETVEMLPLREAPGIWHLPLQNAEEGTYRVSITHRDLPGLAETRELTVRDRSGAEGMELSADLAALSRLSAAGGHAAGTIGDCDGLLQDLVQKLRPRDQERRRTVRLWSSYLTLGMMVAALSAEWILRKRRGLP